MISTYRITLEALAPLLMHNGQCIDPLNDYTQILNEIQGRKSNKSMERELQIRRIQYESSLYISEGIIGIPASNIQASIRDGAKAARKGKAAACGFFLLEDFIALQHDGPISSGPEEIAQTIEELWCSNPDKIPGKGRNVHIARVRIQQSRVIRVRPQFHKWSLSFTAQIEPDAGFNINDLKAALQQAGNLVGLGDWRGPYGRFTAKIE